MKTKPPENVLSAVSLAVLLMLFSFATNAQPVLDNYVSEGLKSNLIVQQKNLTLQQAENGLQTAKSFFLPSINLLGDYTSGDGGRSISIPVGDLLNPVYASLNQLTKGDAFPQIENVNQNFFPKNFYDARVRTSMPIVNTDLYINKSIQGQQVILKQYELDVYKRQLVMDIKTAYYNYLGATEAVKIYESALVLVNKNVEINESLLKNGKSLPANHLRSKSEAEKVKADLNSARNRVANARKYFNFLLNKNLDSEINTDAVNNEVIIQSDTATAVVSGREELRMIGAVRAVSESTLLMNRLAHVPKVNAFLDLGSQASDWKYNNDTRYYLVGVQLTMPLFQGFRNRINVTQTKIELEKTTMNLTNTTAQLQMAAEVAKNDLQTTSQNFIAASEQLKSARSYFHLIEKGYEQGVNSLIEFLDARNQLTASELQHNLRLFEMLTASAKLERETASYSFPN